MLNDKYSGDYRRKAAGIYEYVGNYYIISFRQEQQKRCVRMNYLASAVVLFLLLLTGMANQDSSRTLWIVLPYFCSFLPAAYMLLGAYIFQVLVKDGKHLRKGKGEEQEEMLCLCHSEYQNSLMRLKTCCIGLMLLAGIDLLLEIIYCFLRGPIHNQIGEAWYFAGYLLILVFGAWYGKQYDRMYAKIVLEESVKNAENSEN